MNAKKIEAPSIDPRKLEIQIMELNTGCLDIYLVGTSSIIFNRNSEKAKRQLLMPSGRKTEAEKASQLKHQPLEEYRASAYKFRGDDEPTRIFMPANAFKGIMRQTALDIPGARKTQIGRLTWIVGEDVPIYGIPQMRSDIVRMADAKRTPDVRFRAELLHWCCKFSVSFMQPQLNETAIINLLTNGGIICGVGDFRQEKGAGSHGQFKLVGKDDEVFAHIVKHGGRKIQDAGLASPEYADDDTAELVAWYDSELVRRGKQKEAVQHAKEARAMDAGKRKSRGGNGSEKGAAN